MKRRQFTAVMMIMMVVANMPLTAFAQEYDLVNGNIEVSAEADGKQYVSQHNNDVEHEEQTTKTIITQTNNDATATANTITITAESHQTAEVTLSGVNIDVSGTGDVNQNIDGETAVSTMGEGDVIIELDDGNIVQSGAYHAGLEKNNTGKLTIADNNDIDGNLSATGGQWGAGIGGGAGKDGSNIIIKEGTITATGGRYGAGIGGGSGSSGNNITIEDSTVTATGGLCSAGIGGGSIGQCDDIKICGDAQLKVQGGANELVNAGASIGSGGMGLIIPNYEIEPDISALTAQGKIVYYAPEADMSCSTPTKTVTGTHVHNVVVDQTVDPTYTSTGLTEGSHCSVCGKILVKQEVIPMLQPEETTAESTVNELGEGTAENPVNVASAETSLYHVTNASGVELTYAASQVDGVLAIAVDEDTAVLMGYLSGMQQLQAQGVQTIIFSTKNAVSTFRIADLLTQGSGSDSYQLIHSGAAVAFTIGAANTDIRAILQ